MQTLKELIRPYYLRYIYFRIFRSAIPSSFTKCWLYPYKYIDGSLKQCLPQPPLPKANVLIYPMNDWHSRIQRSQQIAKSLAGDGYNVIYLNPHLGRQFDTAPLLDRRHRISLLSGNLFELHVRLPREPVFHHRMLSPEESNIISGTESQVLASLPAMPGVQIVSLPIWMAAAVRIRQQYGYPILYDCHDLLEGFSGYAKDIRAAESDLIRTADILCFSSSKLLEHHTAQNSDRKAKSILLRNAIDRTLLERVPNRSHHGASPVIGYVGAIEEWFDVEAIRSAAQALPHCRFMLYGRPDHRNIQQQLQFPNIQFCGEVDACRLPEVLSQFDVGIIPFIVNDLTTAANPIKLYEYFGFGMPVVSSDLPEVALFQDLVYIYKHPQDLYKTILLALAEKDSSLSARRTTTAAHETWDHRAQMIAEIIQQRSTGAAADQLPI